MKAITLALVVLSAAVAAAAPYAPNSRKPPLSAFVPNTSGGTGVAGGIPTRTTATTLDPTGDTTDRKSAIESAMAAASSGQQVVLAAGDHYVSSLQFGSTISGKTLKAAPGAKIILTGTGGITIAGSGFYGAEWSAGRWGDVLSGVSKGSTSITVDDPDNFIVGRLIRITPKNDETLPTLSVSGYDYLKGQNVICTSVNTSTGVVTFEPALYQDYVKFVGGDPLPVKWALTDRAGSEVSGAGLEDLFIEVGAATPAKVITFTGASNCWVKNVIIRNIQNYGISIGDSAKVEVRDSWIDFTKGNWTTPNHAGIEIGSSSALLIENNTINRCFPAFEMQGGFMSGSVIAYNFFYDGGSWAGTGQPYAVLNASHGGGTFGNLYEGNISPHIVWDGYFGGADGDIVFRNYFHGTSPQSTGAGYPVTAARFSRNHEFVGNQFGDPRWVGDSDGISFGNSSAFGGGSFGTANNLDGDPHVDTLLVGTITRTDDTLATVTMPTLGSLVLYQWPISLTWDAQTVGGTPVAAGIRISLHVLALDGGTNTVTVGDNPASVNNSIGVIPPTGTVVRVWPGPSGFPEVDLAVAATTLRLGNTYIYHSGIPAGEALGSTTLPDSLFRSGTPDYFTDAGISFPPFNPASPNYSFSATPAGARFVNLSPPRLTGALVVPAGNRIKVFAESAVTVGSGGGGGMAFSSNPSGGAVTLTYNAGESTSTEVVFSTSRIIADDETLPDLIYTQPGNGLEDGSGNDVWSTWEIRVASLSDVTTGGEWLASAPVSEATSTLTYGAYQTYRSKITLATGRTINRFRIYTTGHLYDASEQVGIFNSSGVKVAGGVATATGSLSPHYLYASISETYLPAGDYWLAIHHGSNGGDTEIKLAHKSGTGIGVGWYTTNSPDWPASLSGNLPLGASPSHQNGGFAFALRAVDDGTVALAPQFTPGTGTYASGQTVAITSGTPDAVIYITDDGTDPTSGSTLYSGPITPPVGTTVIKAIATKAGLTDSAVQTATYTIVAAPSAPSSLSATAVSSSQINLTWSDNSDNESGFRIERRVGVGSWSTVTSVSAGVTSYSNTGLTAETTYEYRVYAYNGAGDSTASNTDSATTDAGGGGEPSFAPSPGRAYRLLFRR